MEWIDREVLVLTKQGIWLSGGIEISHEPTRTLFSKSLIREQDGYSLKIGKETKRVWVEDTAYFVTRLTQAQPTRPLQMQDITLHLSDDTSETLKIEALTWRADRLSVWIKNKKEEARFMRQPYLDLLQLLKEDETGYHLDHHYLLRKPA